MEKGTREEETTHKNLLKLEKKKKNRMGGKRILQEKADIGTEAGRTREKFHKKERKRKIVSMDCQRGGVADSVLGDNPPTNKISRRP